MSDSPSSDRDGWIVKFVPFSSSVSSPFWVRYCREKLETIQLSEEPVVLHATYGVEGPPLLQCEESSFRVEEAGMGVANERVGLPLSVLGFNLLEAFQSRDKNQMLNDFFVPKFLEGDVTVLTSVLLLVFSELKNHRVLYWFGMPALLTKSGKSIRAIQQQPLADVWTQDERNALAANIESMRHGYIQSPSAKGLPAYFICNKSTCAVLGKDTFGNLHNKGDVVFGFFDPLGVSTPQAEQPMGWPMRNLIAYLCYHLDLGGKTVKILSYRPKRLRRIPTSVADANKQRTSVEAQDESILLHIVLPTKDDYGWDKTDRSESKLLKVVGWELNNRGKPGPRSVNLRPLLDSNHLAIQAADLNLKLMKWRMIPDLKVDLLRQTKVLLIGAGTLGCSVARVLVGWGIRNVKIVDYGNVSYSNPVRQSLFTLEDCDHDNGSGKPKAAAAADALKTIAADMKTEGIKISIPMPGHSSESRESITYSLETLDTLVQECDVVYLLTDTRESRWLPTLMAAVYDKMLINAALGLDSWLVMRHGGGVPRKEEDSTGHGRLGCYFCNDILAPENSSRNRTLDQQCTVTRPGLAPIASSMAVELMVSLLHHPKREAAAAPKATSNGSAAFSPTASRDDPSSSGPLGIIPHQIRGSLVSYTMMTPTVPAFKHCTACSAPIIEAYRENKAGLVFDTCKSADGTYLENISGLTDFRAEAASKIEEVEDWDDDEE